MVGVVAEIDPMLGSAQRPRLYWSRFLWGFTRTLSEYGVGTCTVASAEPSFLTNLAVDAFMVIAVPDYPPAAKVLVETHPVVVMGKRTYPGASSIAFHDLAGITTAALDHLFTTGAQYPGMMAFGQFPEIISEPFDAYRAWCASRDLQPIILNDDDAALPDQVSSAFERGLDAIYSPIGGAERTLDVLRQADVSVPPFHVAVLGEGALERLVQPPLMAVSLHGLASGSLVAGAVHDLLETGKSADIELPWQIIPSDSEATQLSQ